jgi:hypothetical protein
MFNKTYQTAVYILLVVATCTSCQDFLETNPPNLISADKAITTAGDIESVLTGAYDGFQSVSVAGGNYVAFGDLMSDDAMAVQNKLNPFGTREIYDGATSVQIGDLRAMWGAGYSVINRANNVIAAIEGGKISGPEFDKMKDRARGEALFLRAYVMFNLVQFWALPYDVTKPGGNVQPGIVLRTTPTLNGPEGLALSRATVEEVYAQVVKDLQEADAALSAGGQPTSVSRASAFAAKAMLARVYFFMGDYVKAKSKAEEVINSRRFALTPQSNLLSMFTQSGSGNLPGMYPEVIMQLVNIQQDQSNSCAGFYRQASGAVMYGDAAKMKDLYSSYDKRRTDLFKEFGPFFFCRKYDQTGTVGSNVRLIRLAEMHLIRAESGLRSSNSVNDDVLESLNLIRQRALVDSLYVPVISGDINAVLDSVQLERRRELIFEGDRYYNVRRLGLPLRDGRMNYAKYLFKIPQEEIAGNPDIVQNP